MENKREKKKQEIFSDEIQNKRRPEIANGTDNPICKQFLEGISKTSSIFAEKHFFRLRPQKNEKQSTFQHKKKLNFEISLPLLFMQRFNLVIS